MESERHTGKGGAREVVSATNALLKIVRAEHGLKGIDVHIKSGQKPGFAECTVDIHGDTKENAEDLAKPYEEKGWTCQSSGETDVRCTSPD